MAVFVVPHGHNKGVRGKSVRGGTVTGTRQRTSQLIAASVVWVGLSIGWIAIPLHASYYWVELAFDFVGHKVATQHYILGVGVVLGLIPLLALLSGLAPRMPGPLEGLLVGVLIAEFVLVFSSTVLISIVWVSLRQQDGIELNLTQVALVGVSFGMIAFPELLSVMAWFVRKAANARGTAPIRLGLVLASLIALGFVVAIIVYTLIASLSGPTQVASSPSNSSRASDSRLGLL
jgi:hypothetical protein